MGRNYLHRVSQSLMVGIHGIGMEISLMPIST